MRKSIIFTFATATLLIAITSGCSFQGSKDQSKTGSLIVAGQGSKRVLIDGTDKGPINGLISDIPVGKHTVAIMDGSNAVLTKDVLIVGGDTVTISNGIADNSFLTDESTELTENNVADNEISSGEEFAESKSLGGSTPAYTLPMSVLTDDFQQRDSLPQTHVSKSQWSRSGPWGPAAATYPAPRIPNGINTSEWKRERVGAVAQKYLGLRYKHVHIPAMGGLDCSNFTSWVYNYGLGIKFTSSVAAQGATAGTRLSKGATLVMGDLLYFNVSGKIGHTGIYLGNNLMIDESSMNNGGTVAIKHFNTGWPKSHFAFARRVI